MWLKNLKTALRLGTLAQRLLLRQSAISIIWYCRAPQTFFFSEYTNAETSFKEANYLNLSNGSAKYYPFDLFLTILMY